MIIGSLSGKKVTVMGLGLFSGGVETVKFLVNNKAKVTVTDLRDEKALSKSLAEISSLPVSLKLGFHMEEDFTSPDLLVINPAVQMDSSFVQLAVKSGVTITTEMNLFFERCRAPIIAVTGSNGKTTTAYIIAEILKTSGLPHNGSFYFGGNIGKSLIAQVDSISEKDLVVLEMSSFQLERLRWLEKSPHISVATNISPNHLDWHKTMEEYELAKRAIIDYQLPHDYAVLNINDTRLKSWTSKCRGKLLWFSSKEPVEEGAYLDNDKLIFRRNGKDSVLSLRDEVRLPGLFNIENYLAAFCAVSVLGASAESCRKVTAEFPGVEHRLEFVRQVKGVKFYNDSIATTPESTIAALSALESPIILIAGGSDKNLSYDAVGKEIALKSKSVVLVGATAPKIEEAVRRHGKSDNIYNEKTFENAVRKAFSLAKAGDVVLLSPASASFDMFTNFEQRGRIFKQIASKIADKLEK
ncbi:MAG: UDP-N-acetylmuramoyl-L-alanine--D-glutamate ligase [Planctomycetota bacterium]